MDARKTHVSLNLRRVGILGKNARHLKSINKLRDRQPAMGLASISYLVAIARDNKQSPQSRWSALGQVITLGISAVHLIFILAFVVFICVAWTGQPIDAPTAVCAVLWLAVGSKLVAMALPTAKRVFVGKAKPPLTMDIYGTIFFSVLFILMVALLNVYSRGGISHFVYIGRWDWQRSVMVWVYWIFSFFLMQVYGIIFAFAGLVLAFTGCCFFGCCNLCGHGPFFDMLRKQGILRNRKGAGKEKGALQTMPSLSQSTAERFTRSPSKMVGASFSRSSRRNDEKSAEIAVSKLFGDDPDFAKLRNVEIADKSSKDGPDPFIDFVENKAQIGYLTPVQLRSDLLCINCHHQKTHGYHATKIVPAFDSHLHYTSAHLCLRLCGRFDHGIVRVCSDRTRRNATDTTERACGDASTLPVPHTCRSDRVDERLP